MGWHCEVDFSTAVKRYSTLTPMDGVRYSSTMDLRQKILDRIAAQSTSVRDVSLRAKLSAGGLRDFLAGRSSSLKVDTLEKVASALDTPLHELLPGGSGGAVDIPITHEVAAGAWRAVDEARQAKIGTVTVPGPLAFPSARHWAELVRGESMNRIIPDGARVHVVDAVAIGYAPRHGDIVVVVRRRAQGAFEERSLKQVRLASSAVSLWPCSHSPDWQAPLTLDGGPQGDETSEIEIVGLVLGAYLPLNNLPA
jgi:SOS-response transcriptional repressor LexA